VISLALIAVLAAAPPVDLKLPPSDDWLEGPDSQPLAKTAKSRLFVSKSNPGVVLRVLTESTLRLEYSPAVLSELSRRLVESEKKKPGGTPLKIGEPKSLEIEGVPVGMLEIDDPERHSTVFYLPSEGGDRVITVLVPSEQKYDIAPITEWVKTAKGLRTPDSIGPEVMVGMAAASLSMIGIVLFLIRKKA
jgi:hypothetical protein